MSVSDAALIASLLQQAVALHQRGRLETAQGFYRQVLAIDARQFDALHLSGVIARQLGDTAGAITLISEAIAINPDQAAAHCNLGVALHDAGRSHDALASYQRALELNPDYALAHSNRGNALRKLGRLDDALRSYEHALERRPIYPEASCNRAIVLQEMGHYAGALASAEQALADKADYADAWYARGNALQSLHELEEAADSYQRALAIRPDWAEACCARGTALQRLLQFEAALLSYDRALFLQADYALAHYYRGNTLRSLERGAEAVTAYRQALAQAHDGDGLAAQIEFALASLGSGPTPPAAPAAYVKTLFDQYANHFEHHLVEVLDYQTPALLDRLIRAALGPDQLPQLDVLDLGCGTGLCAPYLRPLARRLGGVDLSDRMLEQARARGLYDSLACADLGDFLAVQHDAWDLAVAADVFVYIGDLAPVFAGVRRALRRGGHFCFSVEAGGMDGADFSLRPSNRYAHSMAYLQRLAQLHGFAVISAETVAARQENDAAVSAYAVLLRSLKG